MYVFSEQLILQPERLKPLNDPNKSQIKHFYLTDKSSLFNCRLIRKIMTDHFNHMDFSILTGEIYVKKTQLYNFLFSPYFPAVALGPVRLR